MKPEEREAWNNRVPVVTSTELCMHCNKLKPDVKVRESKRYWGYGVDLKLRSCSPCYEDAHRQAMAEAAGEDYIL